MRRSLLLLLGFAFAGVLMIPQPAAQSSAPQAYSLTQVTQMTEASMFSGGQPSNLKVYRSGSKELVELTIAPFAANPKGVHFRYLFDFQAHKAYTQDVTNNACSWMKYVSARAPMSYDPITAVDDAARAQLAEAKQHTVGTETINGIPALITESVTTDGKIRTWLAQKGDFPVKITLQTKDGTVGTMMEVKQVDFSAPAASLFVPPASCTTQSQGEWSDSGVRAHAEARIDAQGSASANLTTGEARGKATATLRQGSVASASQSTAAGTGSSAEEFAETSSVMEPSKNACTVLFRVVHAGSMEPITSGLDVSLNDRDVTGQYRNGVLRISNAPPRLSLQVQVKNGAGRGSDFPRACFRPETVLLLVVSPDFIKEPDKWLWVKSGKYATVSAPAESRAKPSASQPAQAGQAQARVTEVHLQVVPDTYSGPCPLKVKLVGTLTADGPGTAYYQFQAGAVGATREGTTNVEAAGTKTVVSEGQVLRTPQVQSVRFLAGMEPRGHQENAEYTDVDLNISCAPAK